jgi:hypothetical protein
MSGSSLAVAGLAVVLLAWAALSALRSTVDRRWAEGKDALAAHAEADRARGSAGSRGWAAPQAPVPAWAAAAAYPAWLFYGAFALGSVALGAVALWLRAR